MIRRIFQRTLCLGLALCIGSSVCAVWAASKKTKDEIDRLKQEKSEAEEKIKAAEQEKSELSDSKAEVEAYLKNLNAQASSISEQISILEKDIAVKEKEIASKQAEVEDAEAQVEKQYADMKKRIQYMYENGQDMTLSYMTAVLTGGLSDLMNQAEYTVNINEYDRNMLVAFQENREKLKEQKAELIEEQEELELLKSESEKKKERVAAQQKAAGTKLSQFNDMLDQMAGEISDTQELVEEKTKLLNQLIKKAEEEERQARIQAAQQVAASTAGGNIKTGDSQISHHAVGLSDYELLLLATMIYCEAGNQGMEGQLAVGYVIMNRIRSALYPNSLEAVLRQSRQFEPAGSGRFDLVLRAEQDEDIPNIVTQSCWDAARAVVNGTSNVGESLFFRTWAPVPSLIENLKKGGVPYWIIRDHVFYYYWTNYTVGDSKDDSEEESDEEPEEEPKEDAEEEPGDTQEEVPEDDGEEEPKDTGEDKPEDTEETVPDSPEDSGEASEDTEEQPQGGFDEEESAPAQEETLPTEEDLED